MPGLTSLIVAVEGASSEGCVGLRSGGHDGCVKLISLSLGSWSWEMRWSLQDGGRLRCSEERRRGFVCLAFKRNGQYEAWWRNSTQHHSGALSGTEGRGSARAAASRACSHCSPHREGPLDSIVSPSCPGFSLTRSISLHVYINIPIVTIGEAASSLFLQSVLIKFRTIRDFFRYELLPVNKNV